MVEPSQVLQFVANGVVYGSVLALGAIGLTLVYGILNLSNFAHGEFVTAGAFLAYLVTVDAPALLPVLGFGLPAAVGAGFLLARLRGRTFGRLETAALGGYGLATAAATAAVVLFAPEKGTTDLVLVAAALVSLGLVALVGVGLDLAVWKPLRRRRATILTLVIVSIGVALVLRNGLQLRFGTGNKSFDRPAEVADRVLGVQLLPEQQFAIVASLALIVLVHLFLSRTRTGKAMRALADNVDLARVTGIDVDRLVLHVWVLAAALGAVSGVLLTLVANNAMNVQMGFHLVLPLFAAVILGGIGSPYGAMLGAFVVGIAMKTSSLWIGSRYELAAALLLLIAVLLLRPQGILGRKVA